jgi:hypothetical protein
MEESLLLRFHKNYWNVSTVASALANLKGSIDNVVIAEDK